MKRTPLEIMKDKKINIIGGYLKGRKLEVKSRDGLRPTSTRTRETLFNWLQTVILNKNCLDLFAGTGALGFECISRGAKRCVFVENNISISNQIKKKRINSLVSTQK